MRFHRMRENIRSGVNLINFDGCRSKGGVHVADRGIRRQTEYQTLRRVRLILIRTEVKVSLVDGIRDDYQFRCGSCLFVAGRNDKRNRLAVVVNLRSAEARTRPPVIGHRVRRECLPRRVLVGHHKGARLRMLGFLGFDVCDTAFTHRGADDESIQRLQRFRSLVGVGRLTGYF